MYGADVEAKGADRRRFGRAKLPRVVAALSKRRTGRRSCASFSNGPISSEKGLHWNIEEIWEGVQAGIRACAALAPEGIASIGVDGWAVDYVRMHESGYPESDPFCYRDVRTERAEKEVHALILAVALVRTNRHADFADQYDLSVVRRQAGREGRGDSVGESSGIHHVPTVRCCRRRIYERDTFRTGRGWGASMEQGSFRFAWIEFFGGAANCRERHDVGNLAAICRNFPRCKTRR